MSVSRSGLVTPFCPLSLNWALLLLGISDLDSGGNYCLALLDEEISERRKGQPSRYTIYLDEDTGPTARSQGVASCRWLITNVTKIVIFMSYYVPWRWYRSWNTSTEGEAGYYTRRFAKRPSVPFICLQRYLLSTGSSRRISFKKALDKSKSAVVVVITVSGREIWSGSSVPL